MAAKVVIVAVPTVLSIASIRVYTVREAPTEGLFPRKELNIYTPVPQSAQAQFVPEQPGAIQSGLCSARESILPVVQAVKGACLSVKTGSVNLYHAGEDLFYYLKDPPPEFLPRFGTITMAGLLGMFLARKGSRLKKVAVPLSLMSAGASVCYPAQTVAVLKVTGKKLYAAGKWSSAAVSSLLTTKPQEPVTKDISQPQAATVPNPVSAVVGEASEASSSSAQNSTIPELEVESSESVPISDESTVASVTPAENSPDQTTTDTNTELLAHSMPAETTAEETPMPVESEEPSDSKQAADDVSNETRPAKPTPSSEPEPEEAAPVEAAPIEVAPVEAAPAEALPLEVAPVEAAPVEVAPVEAAPVEATLLEVAPVEAAPFEVAPVEAPAAEAAPIEAAVVEVAAVEATAAEAAPVEATAAEAAAVEATAVEAAPVEATAAEAAPVEAAAVEVTVVEATAAEAAPVEAAVVEVPAIEATPVEVPAIEAPPSAPTALGETTAEPEAAAEPKSADLPQDEAAEEMPTPTVPTPTSQESATENSKGGSGFKPDPSLMDFGQSSPEDEDLYSTRS